MNRFRADRCVTIFISPALQLEPDHPERSEATEQFLHPYSAEPKRWQRLNAQYWLDQYQVVLFFAECFPEPHSTKQHEDCTAWAAETTPEVLLADVQSALGPEALPEWAQRVDALRLSSMATPTTSARA
ncbi:MAG TPA: hypothetical protein VIV12_06105 [Streptosporangiaceae bacterium]